MTKHLPAFSLLEVLIVVFIIGVAASMVMPRLLRRSSAIEWTSIRDELNNMLYFARQESITSQKIHRLNFNRSERLITVEVEAGEKKPGEPLYEPVYSHYFTSRYELPEQLSLITLKLGKKELFSEHKGRGWCYVLPHGLVEDVALTIERTDKDETQTRTFTVGPFLGVFEERGA